MNTPYVDSVGRVDVIACKPPTIATLSVENPVAPPCFRSCLKHHAEFVLSFFVADFFLNLSDENVTAAYFKRFTERKRKATQEEKRLRSKYARCCLILYALDSRTPEQKSHQVTDPADQLKKPE
ncbi:hypothetical protein J6590_022417 [Homalodisca vitripennis]|nr:hypothetical protein J6590_022417 [Homalodisca vitripennis]